MSIAFNSQCILCYLERNARKANSLGTEEQASAFLKEMMALISAAPAQYSAPCFAPMTAELYHRHYGLDMDRYKQEKADSNAFVLERMEQIRQKVASASDPLLASLKFAILGNYIDFAALEGRVSFQQLEELLNSALEQELDSGVYAALRRDLETGKTLLYLTDNAGEIGFDRIFAEEIAKAFPHIRITFCVRGGPANNDATREDAAAVGIPFPVIDNGTCIPGTWIPSLGQEAKAAMEQADVILAKGQGNAETMLGCGCNVYYAFLVKCGRFQDLFHKPALTPMLVRERS